MTQKYDFTTLIDRKNTGSYKWEQMYEFNPNISDEVTPLSVADMEFKNAHEIINGLKNFLDEAVLGYTGPYESFYNAVTSWQKRRHNWYIENEWIVNTQGIVSALYTAINAFSKKNEGIITFPPVYYPFNSAINDTERTEVTVPLLFNEGYYTIDFKNFEKAAAKPENKILLFCSPHNPGGRVWTESELERLADIAVKHNLYVVSDEIWSDIVMPGYKHTVLATVNEKVNDLLITCTSPSKSFNLAGMMTSNLIISNESIRNTFKNELEKNHAQMLGILGYKSCEIAYDESEAWLDEVLSLINKNQHIVRDYFKNNFPQIEAHLMEGTYVQWIDFSALNLTNEEMEKLLYIDAEFITGRGNIFGEEGNGFERLNIALPTEALIKALDRLGNELKKLDN